MAYPAPRTLLRAAAACVATSLALAGCGLGAGADLEGGGAELRVTRDFGQQRLSDERRATVREDQTVMRLLRSANDVETREGGNVVRAIDGLAGQGRDGDESWSYFVNGIEAAAGAAEYELSPGDVVQWDYRDKRGAMDVRAIVGAFPEPFLHGLEGKRLPTRVECEDAESDPCESVKQALRDAGVPATGAAVGTSGTQRVARVLVATWDRARELPTAGVLELEPERSGVFARFEDDGTRLALLDHSGQRVRDAAVGTGLVAAVRPTDAELLWVVTGLDERGVERAAAAFGERQLRDAFAIVAEPDGVERLPLGPGA